MDENDKIPLGYLTYPFDIPAYYTSDLYAQAVISLFKLGYNPLVCEAHLIGSWNKQERWNYAKGLIEKCDAIVVFHEFEMTSMMVRELWYAKYLGKTVVTVTITLEDKEDD